MMLTNTSNSWLPHTCSQVGADKMQHPDVKSICVDEWAGGIIMYHIRDELNHRGLGES